MEEPQFLNASFNFGADDDWTLQPDEYIHSPASSQESNHNFFPYFDSEPILNDEPLPMIGSAFVLPPRPMLPQSLDKTIQKNQERAPPRRVRAPRTSKEKLRQYTERAKQLDGSFPQDSQFTSAANIPYPEQDEIFEDIEVLQPTEDGVDNVVTSETIYSSRPAPMQYSSNTTTREKLMQSMQRSFALQPGNSIIGSGRVDPFAQYPVPFKQWFPKVVDQWRICAPDLPGLPRGYIKNTWLSFCLQEPALFYLMLLHPFSYCAKAFPSPDQVGRFLITHEATGHVDARTVATWLKYRALQESNKILQDPRRNRSDLAIAIAQFACNYEIRFGDVNAEKHHWAGVKAIVASRGGLSEETMNPAVVRMVKCLDQSRAIMAGRQPDFADPLALRPGFIPTPPGGTPPIPPGLGTGPSLSPQLPIRPFGPANPGVRTPIPEEYLPIPLSQLCQLCGSDPHHRSFVLLRPLGILWKLCEKIDLLAPNHGTATLRKLLNECDTLMRELQSFEGAFDPERPPSPPLTAILPADEPSPFLSMQHSPGADPLDPGLDMPSPPSRNSREVSPATPISDSSLPFHGQSPEKIAHLHAAECTRLAGIITNYLQWKYLYKLYQSAHPDPSASPSEPYPKAPPPPPIAEAEQILSYRDDELPPERRELHLWTLFCVSQLLPQGSYLGSSSSAEDRRRKEDRLVQGIYDGCLELELLAWEDVENALLQYPYARKVSGGACYRMWCRGCPVAFS